MQPVAEIGRGRRRPYGRPDPETHRTYFGRGYVQLTWKANYEKAGRALAVDLVGNPDLAMRPDIAAAILFEGMVRGWFAADAAGRHTLGRYFSATADDPLGARAIVNGSDCAAAIARYHAAFLSALDAAAGAPPPAGPAGGAVAAIIAILSRIARAFAAPSWRKP